MNEGNMIRLILIRILRALIRLDGSHQVFYRICRKYVDEFNGQNDCDIRMNGELRLLESYLPNCKVIFDVGANIGEWSRLALSANDGIMLHCFEPSKHAFEKLMSNNFPDNVCCNNFGLGSKKENKILYIFKQGSGINSLYQRHGLESIGLLPQQEKEEVLIETLDNYCFAKDIEEIDFLKIDVEGHELAVLKGAINVLEKEKIKVIQFEYGGCYIDARILLKDIFEFFGTLSYSFYKIFPKNIKYIKSYDYRLENFQYSNYLIVNNRCKIS